MVKRDLDDELDLELEHVESLLAELDALTRDLEGRNPTVREMTAAGAFLAQLYNGLENMLKRLCRHLGVEPPEGATGHRDLLRMFCEPGSEVPMLFSDGLRRELDSFRNFRHVFFHGYGTSLEWSRLEPGVRKATSVFRRAFDEVRRYSASLA